MDSNVIPLLLTSSLLSAGITSFVNWLIQRSNYKNDYYKKILDKRLQAYESVEKIIDKLNMLTQLDDGSIFHSIFFNHETYIDFILLASPHGTNNIWLENKLNDKLTEFNVFLLQEVGNEVIDNSEAAYNAAGIRIINKVRQFKGELDLLFRADIANMHDVKAFLKHKKDRNRSKYPVYTPQEYRDKNSY